MMPRYLGMNYFKEASEEHLKCLEEFLLPIPWHVEEDSHYLHQREYAAAFVLGNSSRPKVKVKNKDETFIKELQGAGKDLESVIGLRDPCEELWSGQEANTNFINLKCSFEYGTADGLQSTASSDIPIKMQPFKLEEFPCAPDCGLGITENFLLDEPIIGDELSNHCVGHVPGLLEVEFKDFDNDPSDGMDDGFLNETFLLNLDNLNQSLDASEHLVGENGEFTTPCSLSVIDLPDIMDGDHGFDSPALTIDGRLDIKDGVEEEISSPHITIGNSSSAIVSQHSNDSSAPNITVAGAATQPGVFEPIVQVTQVALADMTLTTLVDLEKKDMIDIRTTTQGNTSSVVAESFDLEKNGSQDSNLAFDEAEDAIKNVSNSDVMSFTASTAELHSTGIQANEKKMLALGAINDVQSTVAPKRNQENCEDIHSSQIKRIKKTVSSALVAKNLIFNNTLSTSKWTSGLGAIFNLPRSNLYASCRPPEISQHTNTISSLAFDGQHCIGGNTNPMTHAEPTTKIHQHGCFIGKLDTCRINIFNAKKCAPNSKIVSDDAKDSCKESAYDGNKNYISAATVTNGGHVAANRFPRLKGASYINRFTAKECVSNSNTDNTKDPWKESVYHLNKNQTPTAEDGWHTAANRSPRLTENDDRLFATLDIPDMHSISELDVDQGAVVDEVKLDDSKACFDDDDDYLSAKGRDCSSIKVGNNALTLTKVHPVLPLERKVSATSAFGNAGSDDDFFVWDDGEKGKQSSADSTELKLFAEAKQVDNGVKNQSSIPNKIQPVFPAGRELLATLRKQGSYASDHKALMPSFFDSMAYRMLLRKGVSNPYKRQLPVELKDVGESTSERPPKVKRSDAEVAHAPGHTAHLEGQEARVEAVINTNAKTLSNAPLNQPENLPHHQSLKIICSSGVNKRWELVEELENSHRFGLIERNYESIGSSIQSKLVPYFADIILDERTAIIIYPVVKLENSKDVQLIREQIVGFCLKFSTCWILFLHEKSSSAKPLSTSIITENLAMLNTIAGYFSWNNEEYDVQIMMLYGEDQVSKAVKQICDFTMNNSKAWTPEQWLARDWIISEISQHEQFLLTFPCINSFMAQIMLGTMELRKLLSAPLEYIVCQLPCIPQKVLQMLYQLANQKSAMCRAIEPPFNIIKLDDQTSWKEPSPACETHSRQAGSTIKIKPTQVTRPFFDGADAMLTDTSKNVHQHSYLEAPHSTQATKDGDVPNKFYNADDSCNPSWRVIPNDSRGYEFENIVMAQPEFAFMNTELPAYGEQMPVDHQEMFFSAHYDHHQMTDHNFLNPNDGDVVFDSHQSLRCPPDCGSYCHHSHQEPPSPYGYSASYEYASRPVARFPLNETYKMGPRSYDQPPRGVATQNSFRQSYYQPSDRPSSINSSYMALPVQESFRAGTASRIQSSNAWPQSNHLCQPPQTDESHLARNPGAWIQHQNGLEFAIKKNWEDTQPETSGNTFQPLSEKSSGYSPWSNSNYSDYNRARNVPAQSTFNESQYFMGQRPRDNCRIPLFVPRSEIAAARFSEPSSQHSTSYGSFQERSILPAHLTSRQYYPPQRSTYFAATVPVTQDSTGWMNSSGYPMTNPTKLGVQPTNTQKRYESALRDINSQWNSSIPESSDSRKPCLRFVKKPGNNGQTQLTFL